ncbi:nucleosome assembly protein 1-like 1 [Scaptodrosophila lebanonensis]|uniref:Nucleosome assembly protein 1-like 1 n=1 Tax=Drosophila lebanonensis TaxID=7225 RepID=A0A6J2U3C2_DROLE|nr:nucleosome assembly protein 1-like 1 [Scaptodrosophila lebanonensis]
MSANKNKEHVFEVDKEAVKQVFDVMPTLYRRLYINEKISFLPIAVQNKIVALKNLQYKQIEVEAEFYNDLQQLELQFEKQFKALYDERSKIINGLIKVPKTTPNWIESGDKKIGKQLLERFDMESFAKILKKFNSVPKKCKGIPGFWSTVLRITIPEFIQKHDEPVLKKLTDISIHYDADRSFTIQFHFDKNSFFPNAILTKKYFQTVTVDEDYPFYYEGPVIYKSEGSVIQWNANKNLTIKTIVKKKKKQITSIVVRRASFFDFFNSKEEFKHINSSLAVDFIIGDFFRTHIVPKAILFYTGELVEKWDDSDDNDIDMGMMPTEDEGAVGVQAEKSNTSKKKPNPNPRTKK